MTLLIIGILWCIPGIYAFRTLGGYIWANISGQGADDLFLCFLFGVLGFLGWPLLAAGKGAGWIMSNHGPTVSGTLFAQPRPPRKDLERQIADLERELGIR